MRATPLLVWAFLLAIAAVLCLGLFHCGGHHGPRSPLAPAERCEDPDDPSERDRDDRSGEPCALPTPTPEPRPTPDEKAWTRLEAVEIEVP